MAEVISEPLDEVVNVDSNLEKPSSPRAPKRHQASPSPPSSKRVRRSPDTKASEISTAQPSVPEILPQTSLPPLKSESATPTSNLPSSSRHESNSAEERKRGRRLFGGLLSTLSQTGSNTQQKKRQEIEKRQLEKARLQKEEDESRQAERARKLREVRTQQQMKFDEKSMRVRHSNMLAAAKFLSTSAQPKLYYKPWKLLPKDAERIEHQIKVTEALIEHEISEFYRQHGRRLSRSQPNKQIVEHESHLTEKVGERKLQKAIPVYASASATLDGVDDRSNAVNPTTDPVTTNEAEAMKSSSNDDEGLVRKEREREKERRRESLDENENHEVLMEGEEDTVIY